MKTIIGIDPGVTGAIAVLNRERFFEIRDMPSAKTDGFNGIDPNALSAIIRRLTATSQVYELVAYSEKSILPPGNGKMATRSIYDCRGVIRSVLALLNVPLIYVPPQTWKKHHGIPPGSDKEYSRGFALQRLPALSQEFQRKKDHNRAEAALIALYGWSRENKSL